MENEKFTKTTHKRIMIKNASQTWVHSGVWISIQYEFTNEITMFDSK